MSDVVNVSVEDIQDPEEVLDVREDYEWEAGHIAGALHIPLGQLPERLDELDPDVDYNVICRTGGRSYQATQWLNGNGYGAVNVRGGMDAWLVAEKPIVSENGQTPTVK